MTYVYDEAKANVLIDRGATLLLAALEVGPHIKPLRAETGIPHAFITNASWWLRRAAIWKQKSVAYTWLSAYHQQLPEGVEGLMEDAQIAAGLHGPALHVWSAQRSGRHKRWNGWEDAPKPSCGTSVALARHERAGESCDGCVEAAAQRRAAWLERKARIQAQRAEWTQQRAEKQRVDAGRWSALLEGETDTKLVKQTYALSLDEPVQWDDGAGRRDGYDLFAGALVAGERNAHNLEWVDETYESAEPGLSTWLDGRQWIDLSFPEVREVADERVAGFSAGRAITKRRAPVRHDNRKRHPKPVSSPGSL